MSSTGWDSFARVNASERWRRQSAAMGRGVTEAIVAEARIEPGMRVIDVASGTGEPAISIAGVLAGTGLVCGSDISPGPLAIATGRAAARELRNMHFIRANVHDLPFADGLFDRATSRLGIMFFADLPRALGEIRRVLRPGGRASLLAWGPFEQPYFQATAGTVLRRLPHFTLPAPSTALFKFGAPGTLSMALREARFSDVEERLASEPWNWPGAPEELWEYFQQVTIPFQPLLQAIPPEHRDEITQDVLAALRKRYNGREVKFDAQVVLASGTKQN